MALIRCMHCYKQISDKASVCPHCGSTVDRPKDVNRFCEDCGTELSVECTSCPVCGCPVPAKDEVPQKVEVTSVTLPKMKRNVRKYIVIIVLLIFAAIAGLFVNNKIQAQKAAEEAAKLREEYAEKLDSVSYTMLMGAIEAENAGNLIKSVWYDAIHKEYNTETIKYTRPDSSYPYVDFNTALSNLFKDSTFIDKIDSIESNQDSVSQFMKDLKNPPEEYRDAYEALRKYYDAYTALVNLVTSPSGSLQSFTQDFLDADTALANSFETMQMYLDD